MSDMHKHFERTVARVLALICLLLEAIALHCDKANCAERSRRVQAKWSELRHNMLL
jgi:hypothetical protein